MMKYITINNRKVSFTDEKNVLSIIRKAGILHSVIIQNFLHTALVVFVWLKIIEEESLLHVQKHQETVW